jgi:uncharacterized protein (TIGR02284 family)
MVTEMADETLDTLAKLIETCRDGQAGYLEASELARNSGLREFFSRQALERARFAAVLEHIALRLGDPDPGRGPSIANKLHLAWIDLKHRLGGGDAGVLKSVEVGENNAQQHYQEALHAGLPPEVHNIVDEQAESVSAALEQVRTLCGVYKRAA